jgi:imidazolonepropionase-like amidohydrolase
MLHTLVLLEKIALVGGLLHSMVPGAPPAVGTILIDHGLIEAVGPKVVVPADAKVYDLAGKHVLPGLVDAMVNFDPDHDLLYLLRRDVVRGSARTSCS